MGASPDTLELAKDLGAVVLGLDAALRPRFLALLERRAADRYDAWAATAGSADEAAGLAACAARERAIAERIESHFPPTRDEANVYDPLVAQFGGAYLSALEGRTRHAGYAMQAFLERAGAATWRSLATNEHDPRRRAALLECAALEEASAEFLEQLCGASRP